MTAWKSTRNRPPDVRKVGSRPATPVESERNPLPKRDLSVPMSELWQGDAHSMGSGISPSLEAYVESPLPIQEELLRLFRRDAPLTIFDIGSCEGLDSIRYARLFPKAMVCAFEPVPDNVALLQENLERFGTSTVRVFPLALSDRTGEETFYISSGTPDDVPEAPGWNYGNKSSSLLPPGKVTEHHEWLRFEHTIRVPTDTLENVCCREGFERIDVIHLDVQGAELKVLEGAGSVLETVQAIWLEVEKVPLYEGQPLEQDVESFMSRHGFVKHKESMTDVSGDQLYVNTRFHRTASVWQRVGRALGRPLARMRKPRSRSRSRKAFDVAADHAGKVSYAQCGEDLIVRFIFDAIGIETPSYIDVGAYDPHEFSNTKLFYLQGSRGVNVEPDPISFARFLTARPEDTNLNVGVADEAGTLDFYRISSPTLSTFSKEEIERYEAEGHTVESVIPVPVETLAQIIEDHCQGRFPDFLSLDVEGMGFCILKSIDYEKLRPTVICVETITYSNTGRGEKEEHIIEFLVSQGYLAYADTYINTIFVSKDRWIR